MENCTIRTFKNLCACYYCKLILSSEQWDKMSFCPNCTHEVNDICKDFKGIIAYMLPGHSWVARWNQIEQNYPGLYAVWVPGQDDDDEPNVEEGGIVNYNSFANQE